MDFQLVKNNLKETALLHPDCTAELIKQLDPIYDLYELLILVRNESRFFINNHVVDRDWFAAFDPEILEHLNIFIEGSNNILKGKTNFSALVLDCHLTAFVTKESCTIKVFGKGYLDAVLCGASANTIALYGKSTAEVTVKDAAVLNISFWQNSNLIIDKMNDALVMLNNKSNGELITKPELQSKP